MRVRHSAIHFSFDFTLFRAAPPFYYSPRRFLHSFVVIFDFRRPSHAAAAILRRHAIRDVTLLRMLSLLPPLRRRQPCRFVLSRFLFSYATPPLMYFFPLRCHILSCRFRGGGAGGGRRVALALGRNGRAGGGGAGASMKVGVGPCRSAFGYTQVKGGRQVVGAYAVVVVAGREGAAHNNGVPGSQARWPRGMGNGRWLVRQRW